MEKEKKEKSILNKPLTGLVITVIGLVFFILFRGGLLGILGIILFFIGLLRWNAELRAKKVAKDKK